MMKAGITAPEASGKAKGIVRLFVRACLRRAKTLPLINTD
jgi:hypothetical protein